MPNRIPLGRCRACRATVWLLAQHVHNIHDALDDSFGLGSFQIRRAADGAALLTCLAKYNSHPRGDYPTHWTSAPTRNSALIAFAKHRLVWQLTPVS